MCRVVVVMVAFVALALPGLARAQQPPPPSSNVEQLAKEHYERGAKLFAERSYIAALGAFAAGYELVKKPMFLFNMGECARLAGDRDEARGYYQRYLATEPTGKYATLAKQRLDALAAEAAQPQPPAPSREPGPVAGPQPPPGPTQPAAPTPAPTPAEPVIATRPAGPQLPSQRDGRPAWMPPTPALIAGAAGVAVLTISGAFSLRARSKWADAKAHCDERLVCDKEGVALADQATFAADGATVTVILGLAAIAGGAGYWLYEHHRARRAERARVVPTASSQTAGLALVGTF